MGWGVGDGETFESLIEERLNRERAGRPFARYEILNFAVPGYQPLQQLPMLDKALGFAPDAIFYVATGREASRSADYLAEALRKHLPIPYAYLRETARRAGVDSATEEGLALRRLKPFQGEMLSWLYREIVETCRTRGIVPVFVFLPQVTDGTWREETPAILRAAVDAGFIVIDLDDVYRNQNMASIRLAEWDDHPSAAGHRLVAARLYQDLLERGDAIFRRAPAPPKPLAQAAPTLEKKER